MNNTRRAQLRKAIELMNEAQGIIEEMLQEEQEAYDNMPEGLQESERGEAMSDNIYEMEETYDSLGDLVNTIEDIVDR